MRVRNLRKRKNNTPGGGICRSWYNPFASSFTNGALIIFLLLLVLLMCAINAIALSKQNKILDGMDEVTNKEQVHSFKKKPTVEYHNSISGIDAKWGKDIPLESIKAIPKNNENHDVMNIETPSIIRIDDNTPACTNKCLWTTGINGSWVQDWNFSEHHGQYPLTPWLFPLGPYLNRTAGDFVPSKDAPFPWRTSWKWVDNENGCQIDVMTYESLCHVLVQLKIHRIFFHDDSLTINMYEALVNKIGPAYFRLSTEKGDNSAFLSCNLLEKDDSNATSLHVVQVLRNRARGGYRYSTSSRTYTDYNVSRDFLSSNDRALGIFNIGAHYHNISHYTEDMDVMMQVLSDLDQPQNLYFFRATNPGHGNCLPRDRNFNWKTGTRLRPLSNFSEYIAPRNYDWNMFEFYNNYTKHLLLERNRMGLRPYFHYLDIYNMTALRNDAHRGPVDCLHFQEPGPVDWWNHLLFTYLQHLSRDLKTNEPLQAYNNCRRVEY